MPETILRYPEFSEPWLKSADVVLDQAGGAADEGSLDGDDLFNLEYEFVVDQIILFENSIRDPAVAASADTQLLADIYARFWMLKNQNSSNEEMPIPAYDNGRIERTIPTLHGMQEPEDWASVLMRFAPGQLVIPQNGQLECAWENPTVVAGPNVPAGVLNLALTCRTQRTRRLTFLYLPVVFLASTGGGTGPTGKQAYATSSKNPWDEPLDVLDMRMWLDGDYGKNVNWADTRIFRHLLVRPIIQPGDISINGRDNYLPVVAFGSDRQLDHAVACIDVRDEPMVFTPYDGLGFRFTNYADTKTRVTVVVVGRRKPTR